MFLVRVRVRTPKKLTPFRPVCIALFYPGGIEAISPGSRPRTQGTKQISTDPEWGRRGIISSVRTLIEVLRIVCNTGAFEHFNQFFAKGFRAVMSLLIGDVSLHCFPCVCANCECRIAGLPSKCRHADLLVNPQRRRFLQIGRASCRERVWCLV